MVKKPITQNLFPMENGNFLTLSIEGRSVDDFPTSETDESAPRDKSFVVGEKPYKKNSRTAPEFLIIDDKDFDKEKNRLINYLSKTQELGEVHFNNKEYRSFGPLTVIEWNNMFYKHLDHHLKQFGVWD